MKQHQEYPEKRNLNFSKNALRSSTANGHHNFATTLFAALVSFTFHTSALSILFAQSRSVAESIPKIQTQPSARPTNNQVTIQKRNLASMSNSQQKNDVSKEKAALLARFIKLPLESQRNYISETSRIVYEFEVALNTTMEYSSRKARTPNEIQTDGSNWLSLASLLIPMAHSQNQGSSSDRCLIGGVERSIIGGLCSTRGNPCTSEDKEYESLRKSAENSFQCGPVYGNVCVVRNKDTINLISYNCRKESEKRLKEMNDPNDRINYFFQQAEAIKQMEQKYCTKGNGYTFSTRVTACKHFDSAKQATYKKFNFDPAKSAVVAPVTSTTASSTPKAASPAPTAQQAKIILVSDVEQTYNSICNKNNAAIEALQNQKRAAVSGQRGLATIDSDAKQLYKDFSELQNKVLACNSETCNELRSNKIDSLAQIVDKMDIKDGFRINHQLVRSLNELGTETLKFAKDNNYEKSQKLNGAQARDLLAKLQRRLGITGEGFNKDPNAQEFAYELGLFEGDLIRETKRIQAIKNEKNKTNDGSSGEGMTPEEFDMATNMKNLASRMLLLVKQMRLSIEQIKKEVVDPLLNQDSQCLSDPRVIANFQQFQINVAGRTAPEVEYQNAISILLPKEVDSTPAGTGPTTARPNGTPTQTAAAAAK